MTQRLRAGAAERGAASLDDMVWGMWAAPGISVPLKNPPASVGIKLAPAAILSPAWLFPAGAGSSGTARWGTWSPPHPPLLKKSNYKMTGWRERVDVMCLDLCNPFDAVPCKIWLEKWILIDLDTSVVAWIENWLKDCKQRLMTNGIAIKEREKSFPSEEGVQGASGSQERGVFLVGADIICKERKSLWTKSKSRLTLNREEGKH